MRVARLETRMTWSEDPLSRSRHLIGNLEVAPLENGELQAKTASLAHHSHLETGACGNRSRRPVQVQGFGWRPVMTYPRALGPASESPQEGTRGGRMGGCSLWRFDRPAVWIGDPLAGIVGIGSTTRCQDGRRGGGGRSDFGLIECVRGGFGDDGATAVQCRRRGSPVGSSCGEAVMGVMALRSRPRLAARAGREAHRRVRSSRQ
jgi:hypothetical protein